MRTAATWVAGTALALLAVGVALIPLESDAFTRFLVGRYALSAEAGLTPARMTEVAEQTRAYVVDGVGTLPSEVDGREGFDASAVSHLDDVRSVLELARNLIGLLAAGLTVWLGVAVARKNTLEVARALMAAAVITAAFVGAGVLLAVLDFDRFFAAFHGIFFAEGTWTFAADDLLILLFPERFWATAGAAWGLTALLIAVLYGLLGQWLAHSLSLAEQHHKMNQPSPDV